MGEVNTSTMLMSMVEQKEVENEEPKEKAEVKEAPAKKEDLQEKTDD